MTTTMTRTAAQLGHRRCQWPTWLVSAKHRAVVSRDGDRAGHPVGDHHARQSGENLTACGLVAIGWPVFWLMGFQPDDPTSCPECITAVERAAAEAQPQHQGCC